MSELYICKACALNCKLRQTSEYEKQFPSICPHGMIAHYEKTPWLRKLSKEEIAARLH